MGGMGGMAGGSMLRARRKDINVKPNRRLDRKSSRGMIFENEELRLRTININAEVERGQSDIKKLRRENEQLRREIIALRSEYERLDRLLRPDQRDTDESDSCCSCNSDCGADDRACRQNNANTICDENHANHLQANQPHSCFHQDNQSLKSTSFSQIEPSQIYKEDLRRKTSPTKLEHSKQNSPSNVDRERPPSPAKVEIRSHVAFEELPSVPEEQTPDCRKEQVVLMRSDGEINKSASRSNVESGDNRHDDETPVSLPPDTTVSPSSSSTSCATVFPKAAPDVIVNGNQRTVAARPPPYGFSLPPHSSIPPTNTYRRYEEPIYCNVPLQDKKITCCVSVQNPPGFPYQCPVPLNPSLTHFTNDTSYPRLVTQVEQHQQQRQRFHTGGNFEELLSDVESNSGEMGNDEYVKDSIFMCNTRKVIHQKMVHNVTEQNCSQNGCCCQCSCRGSHKDYTWDENSAPVIVELKSADGQTSYVTEKKLDLTYDYPRGVAVPEKSSSPNLIIDEDTEESSDSSKPCKKQTSQTVHTLTEVNSTILLFERKKYSPPRPKGRFNFFSRSQSAPVGENEEPVYATVKKLPKKLKKLNLINLENEVAYQLPSAQDIEDRLTPSKISTNDLSKTTIKEVSETSEEKSNARASKHQDSLDSTQSSSIGIKELEKAHIDEKESALNPKAKKRKRFSFYFRKRNTKLDTQKKPDTGESSDEKTESPKMLQSQRETERTIAELEGSTKSTFNKEQPIKPAETQHKHQNGYCKHKKLKHCNSQESVKCSICLRRPSAVHICEKKIHRAASNSIDRGSCHPKSFLKQDSYQEMTTSHSEHERTNSITSSLNSGCSLTTQKSRKLSAPHADTAIPWCGCWGNSCL